MDGIERRNTRISPRTNGFFERMNRTVEKDETQRDLDRFLEYYNLDRHQGYRLKGRTPAQALREALGVEELPLFGRPRRTL